MQILTFLFPFKNRSYKTRSGHTSGLLFTVFSCGKCVMTSVSVEFIAMEVEVANIFQFNDLFLYRYKWTWTASPVPIDPKLVSFHTIQKCQTFFACRISWLVESIESDWGCQFLRGSGQA